MLTDSASLFFGAQRQWLDIYKDGRTFDASLCRAKTIDRGEWSGEARDGSNGNYKIYGQYADKSVTSEQRQYSIALNRLVAINFPQEGAQDWRYVNQLYIWSEEQADLAILSRSMT